MFGYLTQILLLTILKQNCMAMAKLTVENELRNEWKTLKLQLTYKIGNVTNNYEALRLLSSNSWPNMAD